MDKYDFKGSILIRSPKYQGSQMPSHLISEGGWMEAHISFLIR